ncbi:MAG: 3-methylitaconate isomerase [Acidaminococcus sp.]|jgi:2-methylaconitate cis-trans-isomerase PrpF|nr:3-methylitaconate isomerase [Acidaminococcus sp.]MCI2099499.1 3-methylitaconate isomerase [Acidaminococcus sp.]MCI2113859.1 3-methylitaconate isomerase [Acidaminococcus sp.]MCI2115567.1 3-methylitaconate isomerase [Acidaminococcus sp.]
MENKIQVPVTIMRGGTSKGVYILKKDLPENPSEWDAILLRLMGSPDKKQIDGLGGAQSVTSKVAIINKSNRPDADVDYTFAQVSVDKAVVSYGGNCGNISSGVGPFAIEKGIVPATGNETLVRVYNTNTKKLINETVKTKDGEVVYDGDFEIAGVPGTASPVKLSFVDPSGTLGKGLLPTGHAADMLDVPGVGNVRVSIVDAANPLVFVKAEDVNMKGTETPDEINADAELLNRLERIRGTAAVKLGLTESWEKAAWETPGIPKMTIVAPPASYVTSSGSNVDGHDIDLLGRMMSMQKAHPSYAMTGAMCTAAAAAVPGSLVNEVLSQEAKLPEVRIGHGSGILTCGVIADENGDIPTIKETYGYRTANLLMEGIARVHLSGKAAVMK